MLTPRPNSSVLSMNSISQASLKSIFAFLSIFFLTTPKAQRHNDLPSQTISFSNVLTTTMETTSLLGLLQKAAQTHPNNTITTINTSHAPHTFTYSTLYHQTLLRSQRLLHLHQDQIAANLVVLLHVNNQYDSIIWFWAIVAAGGIPCMSTTFSKDIEQRERHIGVLRKILEEPLVITSEELLSEFGGAGEGLSICSINSLEAVEIGENEEVSGSVIMDYPESNIGLGKESNYTSANHSPQNSAILMLTSGSSGASKAVPLTTSQILASLSGKIALHTTTTADVFLSWTGLDHVANLLEIHLHAVALCANQIHVPSSAVLAEPLQFLHWCSEYKVSYTFAPNFFLGAIIRSLEASEAARQPLSLDLINLRALISGGESNVTETVVRLQSLLQRHRIPPHFLRPGLGLTETCAGAIYSTSCPSVDISLGVKNCSVGYPTPSICVRIVSTSGDPITSHNEIGLLELSGPAVFAQYWNDPKKTEESFTADGYFKTGDMALLDKEGRLHLTGRQKETIIINGVNHYPAAIESVLEAANIPGLTPSYTVAFPYRPADYDTEVLCIIYLPVYDEDDHSAHLATAVAVSKAVVVFCGVRPWKILPLSIEHLQKSSLGKLSRPKIRAAFENGAYEEFEKRDEEIKALHTAQCQKAEPLQTPTEEVLLSVFKGLFPASIAEINRHTDLFSLGFSSVDLLTLQSRLQISLKITSIPLPTIFSTPILHELAAALDNIESSKEYDPVVVLQPKGSKPPLWFIHPGLGEVLIFMNLSRYILDRPVYALRARGFNNEPFFSSMDDIISCYHSAIKSRQPSGPYYIAGYSFGSIVAFEIAKRMEADGDEVGFLASFDQAPYFKERARGYDWFEIVLSVSFFLYLITEEYARSWLPTARTLTRDQVLDHVWALAPPKRIAELGIDKDKLARWADLAFDLKKITWDYDPVGKVKGMDVFYTGPLVGVVKAKTAEEWFEGWISKWAQHVESAEDHEETKEENATDGAIVKQNKGVKFHFVGGTHRTMISPPHLQAFQKVFKEAMAARGMD
ncbi:hypothetical protein B0J14DRAFT_573090 [Halenospora varia]|nr:hypothetical protein B0J14DRAFT_573090 [Halenospora varia]